MGTKCAASTRGVVRMVALSHACVCGKVCAHVSRVPIGNRSRSWPQFYKKYGNICFQYNAPGGATVVFHGCLLDIVHSPCGFGRRAITMIVYLRDFAVR